MAPITCAHSCKHLGVGAQPFSCQLCRNALKAMQMWNKAARRKGTLFTHSSSFLGEAMFPNLSWPFTFSFIPGGSRLPSPSQFSSCGVSTVVRNFHSVLTFKTYRDGWGWRTKPKKTDTCYLGQTDLIMDPEGAIKLTDYRFSISRIWAVWLPLCFHCISSPSFPCFLLEALHWSTSEVKQALTRPNSCLLLLLWKQL